MKGPVEVLDHLDGPASTNQEVKPLMLLTHDTAQTDEFPAVPVADDAYGRHTFARLGAFAIPATSFPAAAGAQIRQFAAYPFAQLRSELEYRVAVDELLDTIHNGTGIKPRPTVVIGGL